MADYEDTNFDPWGDNVDVAPQGWMDQELPSDYTPQAYTGTNWNPNSNNTTDQFNFDSNISNSPLGDWQSNGTDWGMVDQQLGSQFSNPMTDVMGGMQQVPQMTSGLQNTLAGIFNNKGAMTGLGAILEGMQNKKKQSAYTQLAQQMQPAMDPFGSQRGFYQQQLQQAVQDPYSSPIVSAQVKQLQQAQAIKDAQAGRRSNQATSNPALLAAQAQVAQKYMDSLQQPAGANINPSGLSNIMSMLQQGTKAGIDGYASPMMSAVGYNSSTTNNQAQLDAIKKLLSGGQ